MSDNPVTEICLRWKKKISKVSTALLYFLTFSSSKHPHDPTKGRLNGPETRFILTLVPYLFSL